MKAFEKLESLGFFDWLSESHNIRDTDMKPEYLDELPLNDIHRTVANSMAFRWFREKYDIQYWLNDGGCLGKAFIKITGFKHDKFYFSSSEPMEYEEAELYCLDRLIDMITNKRIFDFVTEL